MIEPNTVWFVTLLWLNDTTTKPNKVLPFAHFSKSKALAYAQDKVKLFQAEAYRIEPLVIGDENKAMELLTIIKQALKEGE